MSEIKFTKMQGLGNDFILIDPDEFKKVDIALDEFARKMCDRHFGVGADGIFVPVLNESEADIGWVFLQSDGSTSQMCGNGMRCFAKFVKDNGYVNNNKFKVKTGAGMIIPEILENGKVKVNMNKPILKPSRIPFNAPENMNQKLEACGREFIVNAVSMGNPHCLIFSEGDTKQEALEYGKAVEHHPMFPEKTNVEFIKVLSDNKINVDVWERGCGITLACGTGACASAVASVLSGKCKSPVDVNLPGGTLTIEWAGNSQNPDSDVFMTGDADYVFTGIYTI